jgi:hypothetical protein
MDERWFERYILLEARLREERTRRAQMERRLNEMAEEKKSIRQLIEQLAKKFGIER